MNQTTRFARWHLLLYAAAVLIGLPCPASPEPESPEPEPQERVEVRLAQVAVLARDRSGQPVDDLSAEEVVVKMRGGPLHVAFLEPFHDGPIAEAPPDVRLFVSAPASDSSPVRSTDGAPRFVILLIDVEHDYRLLKPQATEQCVRFLRERLQPGDRVAVFSYDGHLNEELMFTTDREQVVSAVMRAYDRPPRPRLDTRARTQQLIGEFESCRSGESSRTSVGLESCARQAAIEYTDEMRAEADDYLAALEGLIRLAGGLQSRATVIGLSHGAVMSPADVVVEAARAAYGNTEILAGLRLDIGTGEGARADMANLLELAMRERVTLHFIDRNPQHGLDREARVDAPFEAGARPMEVAYTAPQLDLQQMAEQTGGMFLAAQDLYAGLSEVHALERGGYLLGFYLDPTITLKQLNKINVSSRRKGVRLLHGRGYASRNDPLASAGGSLVPGVPLSLAEDGRDGRFIPFTIVVDPERLGYELTDDTARAELTLSVRLASSDGRTLAETFDFFAHAYPAGVWQTGQAEPIQILGWAECEPGSYVISVALKNPMTERGFEASSALRIPEVAVDAGTSGAQTDGSVLGDSVDPSLGSKR